MGEDYRCRTVVVRRSTCQLVASWVPSRSGVRGEEIEGGKTLNTLNLRSSNAHWHTTQTRGNAVAFLERLILTSPF